MVVVGTAEEEVELLGLHLELDHKLGVVLVETEEKLK